MNYKDQMIKIGELVELYAIIRSYEKLKKYNLASEKQILGFEQIKLDLRERGYNLKF